MAALVRSFRLLSPEEAASLRPRVIRTVRAGSGDTAETLARQTVDANPAALFRLLNGLSPTDAVRPGQTVKIVSWAEPLR